MVVIDTDVFLLAFAYHRDERQRINQYFLERVVTAAPGTTVYNLMEFLGKMSFNLSTTQLKQWETWLGERYKLTVIFPQPRSDETADSFFRAELYERAFTKISKEKMPYLDALVLDLAERTPSVEYFVTWNAKHFRNKSSLNVLTPTEYLEM